MTTCNAYECDKQTKGQPFCTKHWSYVPGPLKNRVRSLVKTGDKLDFNSAIMGAVVKIMYAVQQELEGLENGSV
jgi:hypothetical protein